LSSQGFPFRSDAMKETTCFFPPRRKVFLFPVLLSVRGTSPLWRRQKRKRGPFFKPDSRPGWFFSLSCLVIRSIPFPLFFFNRTGICLPQLFPSPPATTQTNSFLFLPVEIPNRYSTRNPRFSFFFSPVERFLREPPSFSFFPDVRSLFFSAPLFPFSQCSLGTMEKYALLKCSSSPLPRNH